MEFFKDIYDFIIDNRELYYKVYQLLECNHCLNVEEIIYLLRKSGYNCQENEVIKILYFLISRQQRIIRNDYLQTRTVKWWQEYYKKSTYYRRKRDAVETFVDCLSL